MRFSRFYPFLFALFTTAFCTAQPYWQKGDRLGYVGGFATVQGQGEQIVNAHLDLDLGGSRFFTQKWAIGSEASTSWDPLTQSVNATMRAQYLLLGRSDLPHSLLADIHTGMGYHTSQTVMGTSFSSSDVKVGLGLQYTWWISQGVGVYLWPQWSRTNGGPSGLWGWQFDIPIGVQWNWHK